MCKISIIIPTYNRSSMLPITIDSFVEQSFTHSFEIIISNNNSTDDTSIIIENYCKKYDFIKTIFVKKQGVHYARNAAAKIAKGEILYFTDDDMIADKNLLSELIKIFDLDENIGTVSGLVLPKFEKQPPEWVEKNLINGWLSVTPKNKKESLIISEHDCGVWSCHQAIKKEAFFKSGGFNPENTAGIWIGDGETGINIKLKALGYKFAYTSKSIIHHIIPPERTTKEYIIKRVSNQGYCDSYTEYRTHRDPSKLKQIALRRLTEELPNKINHLSKLVENNEISEYFILAFTQYYINRYTYDLELYNNNLFRKIVEIDDWLNNDIDIKTDLLKN